MTRVLVMGAGGYIGIPLCYELERRGHDVYAADRFFFEKYPKLKTEPLRVDIRSYEIPFRSFEAVIDLAGLSNDASAEINPQFTQSINVDGAVRLANRAKATKVRRYIYSSSASVYGHGEKTGLTEQSPINPLTDYAKSKVAVEAELRKLGDETFEPVILRNATIFGAAPRMRFDLAVNVMTYRAWKDGVIYCMGSGEQWRPFAHVSDIVSVFCAALEADTDSVSCETFNVGSADNNMQIKTLGALVAEKTGAKVHNIPDDPDRRSYSLNFDKLKQFYDAPFRSIEYGIDEVLSALKSAEIDGEDPRGKTLGWYRDIIAWEARLTQMRLDGRLL